MAKKEIKTDLWVARQLDDSKIKYDAQGSDVKEINDALQSASKRGTGNAGYPEYVAVVKDFVIVIEDKADLAKHQKLTDTGIISADQKDIADYAVNGAYFYAKHIAQNSSFHKIFAIGVSGDEKHHKITPLYVDDREGYKQLPDIESFTSFTVANIEEYYTRYVLAEKTDVEKTTEEILKDAAELHEYLRTYGSLKDQDKPLVVSGILLALDDKFFKPNDLLGDETTTDGQLIYDAIKRRLKASNVGPDAKRDKLMSEFSIIRTSARLNEVDTKLGKTPLKFYTEFLKKNVFDNIKYRSSSEDFIRNMLPVSGQGGLDYAYMSEYVNKKRTIMQKRYREYIASRIAELGQTTAVASLAEKEWRTFVIQDIAEVYSGHDIYAQERTDGSTPLITAVGTNNGIGYFVGNENDSRAERSISVVRNGASVAKAFYHKYSALYGNDCRRMQLKYSESEFVNLFITQVIGMQNKAFSYSRKLGSDIALHTRHIELL